MKTEVRQAIDAGIDGFTINIMSLNGYLWDRTVRMLNAAQAVDPNFDIVLMPDINTGVDSNQVLMADKMAELARHPSATVCPTTVWSSHRSWRKGRPLSGGRSGSV
jgi:hypothetical protein